MSALHCKILGTPVGGKMHFCQTLCICKCSVCALDSVIIIISLLIDNFLFLQIVCLFAACEALAYAFHIEKFSLH